ncbi:MAG TPA: flavodoxin family protein [Methanocella sp.]|uniref:flavodoxin family protein n=1 Tax=Methanocella sp. TaxID=2052833 RepID=UPI002BC5D8BE|nr:flavodoxin family protein [Methanocella sp.]HTY90270.1 flavodoxin family protein [Methanocella sp.]
MKVMAIMGSPRGRGAGYKVVRLIEEQMKAIGPVEFEYLFLKDADLKPCIGCFNCVSKGEDKCPLKDTRADIEKKMLEADGIILSSPGYVQNVSWLMKNFMDRFAYTNHRLRFFRQKVLLVANSGGAGLNETLSAMRIALGGARVVHELGAGTPPWPQTIGAVAKKEKAINIAANKFYRACLDTSLPSPMFREYMRFLIQQRVGIECKEWLPADFEFYSGKDYFYDTKINPVMASAAKAIVGIALNMMKDMGPGVVKWPLEKKEVSPVIKN